MSEEQVQTELLEAMLAELRAMRVALEELTQVSIRMTQLQERTIEEIMRGPIA